MKRLNGKLIASVIVFTCMGLLLGDTNENNTYNQQNSVLFPEDEIDIEIDQGNQNVVDVSVQPPEAALTNRGEFNVHPIDNEQFVSAYETNWNKTGSGQISISQPGNYILLTTSTIGGTGEFNYNFVLSPGIRQARLQVNWSVNSVVGDDIIRWQYYPGSGSDWLNCTETGADGSDDLSEGLYNLTIQANSGYEQNIRVRLRMENYARTVGQIAQIRINSIDIMAFNTEISDTSVGSAYTDLSNQVSITVNIETSGLSSISGITQNPTHYVIYYQTNSSAVNDTVGIPVQKTSGSFTGDFASLTYLFDMPGLYNTTLYYALRVNDTSNYKYWSSTFEINCYDGFAPNNGSVTTIPANLNDLHYDDSLTIVVPVIDSGGMNLSRVNYYWRVGNPVVSNIPGQFDGSNVCYVSGTSDTANLIIPTEALVAYTDTYVQFYIYDHGYNFRSLVTPLKYRPRDLVAPGVTYLWNNTADNAVEIDELLRLSFEFVEPSQASGFNLANTTAVRLCWTRGAPTNQFVYHNFIDSTPSNQFNFQLIFDIDIKKVEYNFILGDVIHFWLLVSDASSNLNSTFDNLIVFEIRDQKAPLIEALDTTLDPLGYNSDRVIQLQIYESLLASGVEWTKINTFYTINSANFADRIALTNTTWSTFSNTTSVGGVLNYSLSHSMYKYLDVVRIWVNATDKHGNSNGAFILGSISIIDDVKPFLTILPQYPSTNLTQIRTLYDLQITVQSNDTIGGSGFNRVEMAYRFNLAGFTWAAASYYVAGVSQGGENYRFYIPQTNITAGQMYYIFRSYDQDGNYYEISSLIDVVDQKLNPRFVYSLGNKADEYLNTRDFKFVLDLSENCLVFLYLNGQSLNAIPYMGTRIEHQFNDVAEGAYILNVVYHTYSRAITFYVDLTPPNKIAASSVAFTAKPNQVILTWNAPEGADQEMGLTYIIYRGSSPDFDIAQTSQAFYVGITQEKTITDDTVSTGKVYYRIVVKDMAGNLSEPSDAIEVDVPVATWVYGAAIAGMLGAVGGVIVLRKRAISQKQTLSERNVQRVVQKEKVGARDDFWETPSDIPSKGASNEPQWQDLSHQAYSTSTSSRVYQTGSFSAGSGTMSSGSIPANDPTAKMNPEMRELYKNAEEFVEMGQESMAAKSYEMLLRMAEKQGDSITVEFIKSKMDSLYQ